MIISLHYGLQGYFPKGQKWPSCYDCLYLWGVSDNAMVVYMVIYRKDGNVVMIACICVCVCLMMRWLCQGVREYSTTLSLEDKLKVDLVIIGSVAVSRAGTLGVAHTHTHASLGSCMWLCTRVRDSMA